MNIKEARTAIEEILASIPDDELPLFDSVDQRDGKVTVWWGGHGSILGSAVREGKRDPLIYRRNGAWDAIQSEMTCRADSRLLANGDDPTGVRLARNGGA